MSETCTWTEGSEHDFYGEGVWHSDCGLDWCLEEGRPSEHEMNYCPKCGRILEEDSQ